MKIRTLVIILGAFVLMANAECSRSDYNLGYTFDSMGMVEYEFPIGAGISAHGRVLFDAPYNGGSYFCDQIITPDGEWTV